MSLTKPYALLYHPREYSKRSNTGRLLKIATDISSTSWHRLKNAQLQAQFKDYALVYPDDNQAIIDTQKPASHDHNKIKGYLILDATWQQSHKIMRQSPWLATLPRVSVKGHASQYQLRRNQQGLSTLESLAYCLIEQNQRNCGLELIQFLHCFQAAFLKARQAGHLK